MERLTKRDERCSSHFKLFTVDEDVTLDDIVGKLAEYEDSEEKGLLLRLPCNVRDTVYCIVNGYIRIGCVEGWGIYETKQIIMVRIDGLGRSCTWGKTVFLTREEAEKALEKLN